MGALAIALFFVAPPAPGPAVLAQSPEVAAGCADAEINLIFQSAPLGPERHHQSADLYAGAIQTLEARAAPGEIGRIDGVVGIVSRLPGARGIQGWAVQTRFTGDISIAQATVDGTAAAAGPDGLVGSGFAQVRIPSLRGETGFYSAVVLSFTDPTTLLPWGTASVLRFTVESRRPQGAEAITGAIEWVDGCSGCTSPFIMSATVNGATRRFCSRLPLAVRFVAPSAPAPVVFLRCDPNGDGRVDIVDAIHVANHLFLDRAPAACLDTEDCNGDRRINLTDVVYAMNYLFDDGPVPPAPFPVCGAVAETIAADSCPPGASRCR